MTRTAALSCALTLALAACSQAPDPAQNAATTTAVAQGTDEGRVAVPAPADTDLDSKSGAYEGPIPKPIMIGGDNPEMDACGTFARVANLDPKGDNYLSVRDAPSTSTKERDRLAPGQGVSVCMSENGWSGIIYGKPGDKTLDCGVGIPAKPAQPYRGSCRQGWVDSRYLEQVAG